MVTSLALPSTNVVLQANGISFARYKSEFAAQKRSVFIEDNTLLFVLQGSKTLHFNNATVTSSPGSLLLLKKGLYMMSEFIPEGENFRALVIYCRDSFLKAFALEHLPSLEQAPMREDKFYLQISSDPIVHSFTEQFLSYFNTPDLPQLDKILHLKLQELLLLLISGSHKTRVMNWIHSIAYARSIDIEYVVRTYLFQPFTLEQLAKFSGKSLAAFKREFQDKFHTSPKKWMNGQRLAYAQTLLQNTQLQIAEVAEQCGYENVPYFTRAFRHEFGQTPTAWRSKSASV